MCKGVNPCFSIKIQTKQESPKAKQNQTKTKKSKTNKQNTPKKPQIKPMKACRSSLSFLPLYPATLKLSKALNFA